MTARSYWPWHGPARAADCRSADAALRPAARHRDEAIRSRSRSQSPTSIQPATSNDHTRTAARHEACRRSQRLKTSPSADHRTQIDDALVAVDPRARRRHDRLDVSIPERLARLGPACRRSAVVASATMRRVASVCAISDCALRCGRSAGSANAARARSITARCVRQHGMDMPVDGCSCQSEIATPPRSAVPVGRHRRAG